MLNAPMVPLLALVFTAASIAAAAPAVDPIVGGEAVEPGDFPATVHLDIPSGDCTGTLLTPALVLTAAHCLQGAGLQSTQIEVSLGDTEDGAQQVRTALEFAANPLWCNPQFDPSCDVEYGLEDFAWILVDRDFEIDAADLPVILDNDAEHHRVVRSGTQVHLVGYGEDDALQFDAKRTVTTTIGAITFEGLRLAMGGDGRDSCRGDSGGPAFARLEDGSLALVGVLSAGSMRCGNGGLYGAPLPALCWIRDSGGVDVVPDGCEDCDCVDLTPRSDQDDGRCSIESGRGGSGWWLGLMLAVWWLHRRPRRNGRVR